MFSSKKNNFDNYDDKHKQWGDFVVDLKSLAKKKMEDTEKQLKEDENKVRFSWLWQLFKPKQNKSQIFKKIKQILKFPVRIVSFILWLLFAWMKLISNFYLILIGKKKINYLKYYYQIKKIIFFKKVKTYFKNKIKTIKKLKNKAKSQPVYLKKPQIEKSWPDQELKSIHKKLTLGKSQKKDDVDDLKFDKHSTWKRLGNFLFIILLLLIPFQLLNYYNVIDLNSLEAKILNRSESALDNLEVASKKAKDFDMSGASNYFSQAGKDFSQAKQEVEKIDKALLSLASLSNNPKLKLASQSDKILQAGALASELGQEMGLAFDALLNSQTDQVFAESLKNFSQHAKKATKLSSSLSSTLKEIKVKSLPEEYAVKLTSLQTASLTLSQGLDELSSLADNLQPFLGVNSDKRYLLIFQNNNELRASGGFMGSFALADIRDGKIINLEVPKGGTYDTEAGLLKRIEAPKPLWLVNPRWYFWDSNWWPDWKKSAQNIAWFYEESDGPTVDGVIAFTPTVLEELLRVIGPVSLPEYDLEISADNFWQTVQPIVEEKTMTIKNEGQALEVKNNQPKKIIGDLMFKILEEMPKRLNSETIFSLLQSSNSLLAEKQVLFYFTDNNLQEIVEKHNWAGRIKETKADYLSVVNSNIAGQKTDRMIKQQISHVSQVQADGSIINTVKISRQHTGIKRQEFTGVRNVNWLRVYVPLGSELLQAEGFSQPDSSYFEYPDQSWLQLELLEAEREAEVDDSSLVKIYTDSDKTVFANWTMLDPGETQTIVFEYKLPFNFYDFKLEPSWQQKLKQSLSGNKNQLINYSLLAQKQAGDMHTNFSTSLEILNKDLQSLWYYPQTKNNSDLGWYFEDSLDADHYFSALWQSL